MANVPSDSTLTPSDSSVLSKALADIQHSHELHAQALDGQALPESVRQGCDVTLSHMNLSSLPAELIELLRNDVARLALDNNRLGGLSGLSARLGECVRLRYLVMRNNSLREFPLPILNLPSLELLDLKGNRISSLPEDLSRLRNLRVFSIYHNRVTHVPLCMGQMTNLVHFAARRNPITFPRPEEWVVDDSEADPKDKIREDHRIRTETAHLKAALVAYANQERLRAEDTSEQSEENVETPRPARRKTSGRFPIKPSIGSADFSDESALFSPPLISPPLQKPPPMSLRSSSRLPSQVQTAALRPGVVPLLAFSERNRSNSESQMSTTHRLKRMGVITKKPVAQASNESDQSKRLSHLRGLSHGSALLNGTTPDAMHDTISPGSPIDSEHRSAYVRRLSSLPEGKRKSHVHDPVVELARGVVYALEQISSPIKRLISGMKDGKRAGLERIFQLGLAHVDSLDQTLLKIGQQDEENEEWEKNKSPIAIRTGCENCIRVYEQLLTALQPEIRGLVSHDSPHRVRTLMHMLYASLVEVRNACSKLGVEFQSTPRPSQHESSRGRYLSPAPRRPMTSIRVRDQTPIMSANPSRSSSRARHIPAPSTHMSGPFSAASRTGSMASLNSALTMPYTPLTSAPPSTAPLTRLSRSNTLVSVEEMDEETQFENIYLKLSASCEFAVQALPRCLMLIMESTRVASERGMAEADVTNYEVTGHRCKNAMDAADALRKRLSTLKLKEPGIRSNPDFWQLCTSFIRAYFFFAGRVKDCYHSASNILPDEIKNLLKPLQRAVKESSRAVNDSIWGSLAATPGQQPIQAGNKSTANLNGLNHNVAASDAAPIPLSQPQTRQRTHTYTQQQRQHPQLSLHTRGIANAPPNALDPLSAASNHSASGDGPTLGLGLNGMNGMSLASGSSYATPNPSHTNLASLTQKPINASLPIPVSSSFPPASLTSGISSGYVTPLPATPLSAALGPAAGATVPLPVSIPLSNLAAGANGMNGTGNLGGLLPTAMSGIGAGLLPAASLASSTAGLSLPPSTSTMGGPSNGSSHAMVAGLQGYLTAAGAVPVSGMPVPMSMPMNVNGAAQMQAMAPPPLPPPPLLSPMQPLSMVIQPGLVSPGAGQGMGPVPLSGPGSGPGSAQAGGGGGAGLGMGQGMGPGQNMGPGPGTGTGLSAAMERSRSLSQRR